MGKLHISTRTLGEVRKRAIEGAYLPKTIKKCCRVSVNSSGEVTISKTKKAKKKS